MPNLQNAARIEDPTEHGGEIVEGSDNVLINGRNAAREEDYHTCPEEGSKGSHVGGKISEGSKTVLINRRHAARVKDGLLCDGPTEEQKAALLQLLEDHCEWSDPSKTGYEDREIGDKRKAKAFAYAIDAKLSCRAASLDESVTGAYGTSRIRGDLLRGEGTFRAGYANDPIKGTGFAGFEGGLGGALAEGKLSYGTPSVPIPGTGYGVSLEVEGTLSVGTAEAKVWAGAKWGKDGIRFGGEEKLGGIIGQGVKVALVIKPLNPTDLPQDRIKEGSPDVLIGE